MRLWDFYAEALHVLLDDDAKTLEEADLSDNHGQDILIQVQGADGTWPGEDDEDEGEDA